MQTRRIPIVPPAAERRIRREARSATLRERAWALRQAGWTLSDIGQALGVSTTRAFQLVRKAKRLIRSNEEGAPSQGRPSDSNSPLPAGLNSELAPCVYPPTRT